MALLFNAIEFPDMSRMTGIWVNKTHDPDAGDEVVMAQMIVLPSDQDPVVESGFLCAHIPFHIACFHGVFADGQGWMVVLQKASAALSQQMVGATDPHWVLVDGISRALRFNAGAEADQGATWDRDVLEAYYEEQGASLEEIAGWSVSELVWGLLVECCNVPLLTAVTGYEAGCAYPDREHICQGDVFSDVFSLWTARPRVGYEESEEYEELEEIEPDETEEISDKGFIRWTAQHLERFSLPELHMMAREDGWESADITGVPKEVLIELMVTGQVIPPKPD